MQKPFLDEVIKNLKAFFLSFPQSSEQESSIHSNKWAASLLTACRDGVWIPVFTGMTTFYNLIFLKLSPVLY